MYCVTDDVPAASSPDTGSSSPAVSDSPAVVTSGRRRRAPQVASQPTPLQGQPAAVPVAQVPQVPVQPGVVWSTDASKFVPTHFNPKQTVGPRNIPDTITADSSPEEYLSLLWDDSLWKPTLVLRVV